MEEGTLPLALVTGAGHRLGNAIARALAQEGYAIGLHYHRSAQKAAAAQAELEGLGAPVFPLPADLTNPAQVDRLFERVANLGHPLKVLVNSAGVMQRSDLKTMQVEEWEAVMAINLRAPWLCARAAATLMETTGGGAIVNISDSGAGKAWTGYPAYIVSKAALESLTRILAKALAPNVRVNAVAPGLILPSPDMAPEQWQRLVDRLPLKKAGSPDDIAGAVLTLIRSPYITGQTLAVDGGYQLV